MAQLLLIPDPRPLEERLGGEFFRQAPQQPGVYLMRDAAGQVLYVGKAKNLRQRLQNYRIANPDRMPRRHLRMVRQVARIDFQFCAGESAALRRESKLLRSLKPRFNRAGVWPGKTSFLLWRISGGHLELAVKELPELGWHQYGPMGGQVRFVRGTLARLFWLAGNPGLSVAELPAGWARGRTAENVSVRLGAAGQHAAAALSSFLAGKPEPLEEWWRTRLAARTNPFERALIEENLEFLRKSVINHISSAGHGRQLALL